MGKSILVILIFLCGNVALSQSGSEKILLTNYTVTADVPTIGKFVDGTGDLLNVHLEGPTAGLFKIVGSELRLSEKGRRYFRATGRCDITVQAGGRGRGNRTFSIIINDFLSNPVVAHRGYWKKTGDPQNSIAALKSDSFVPRSFSRAMSAVKSNGNPYVS